MKSTQEIADRLVELCRLGEYQTCYRELYADDATSTEPEGSPEPRVARGMDEFKKKGEQWNENVEAVYSSSTSDPIVAGDQFACTMSMDWKMKGQPRTDFHEIAVYKVKDGKIIAEQFYY